MLTHHRKVRRGCVGLDKSFDHFPVQQDFQCVERSTEVVVQQQLFKLNRNNGLSASTLPS